MRRDGDRSDARTTATVRNAERLVQVQMRHIRAYRTRPGQPDESIEVGAIDVNLATHLMHGHTYLANTYLENTMRRGISQHDRGDSRRVRVDLHSVSYTHLTLPTIYSV